MANLHLEYYKQTGIGQESILVNKDIYTYIENATSDDFSKIIQNDSRFQVFYHLSSMRTSVLNWYEFPGNANILELGGEFGALTGMLCDKCAHVVTVEYGRYKAEAIAKRCKEKGNLDIYAGDILDIPLKEKFDFIVMIGCLERQCGGITESKVYVEYLKKIMTLLEDGGKLLLAVDNRYGLRYLCGEVEPYTKKPFGGINLYQNATKGYTFSRKQLEDILDSAGLTVHKFFYPMPDYKLAQMVYSDDYLPQKDIGDRVICYHVNKNTLVASESSLYQDVVYNGVFPFLANSFLVEASTAENLSDVVFAAITTDRGKECGLATSIHKNSSFCKRPYEMFVKKRALFQEGYQSIQQVYQNIKELERRGIPVVTHKLKDCILEMPYIKQATCSEFLREVVEQNDKELFLQIFSLLYENLLKSSDKVMECDNEFPDKVEKEDYGPILKKCYIDMVPFNCFYLDGKLYYFDQEFVRRNYPAKYPLFRAITYTYHFIPQAEKLCPLRDLQEQYGLRKLWKAFCQEENRFTAQNRRRDIYRYFYEWTQEDREVMMCNAELLLKNMKK